MRGDANNAGGHERTAFWLVIITNYVSVNDSEALAGTPASERASLSITNYFDILPPLKAW